MEKGLVERLELVVARLEAVIAGGLFEAVSILEKAMKVKEFVIGKQRQINTVPIQQWQRVGETRDVTRESNCRSLVQQKIQLLKTSSSLATPICFRCTNTGHLAKHCTNAVLCFVCNRRGHRAAQCRAMIDLSKADSNNLALHTGSKNIVKAHTSQMVAKTDSLGLSRYTILDANKSKHMVPNVKDGFPSDIECFPMQRDTGKMLMQVCELDTSNKQCGYEFGSTNKTMISVKNENGLQHTGLGVDDREKILDNKQVCSNLGGSKSLKECEIQCIKSVNEKGVDDKNTTSIDEKSNNVDMENVGNIQNSDEIPKEQEGGRETITADNKCQFKHSATDDFMEGSLTPSNQPMVKLKGGSNRPRRSLRLQIISYSNRTMRREICGA